MPALVMNLTDFARAVARREPPVVPAAFRIGPALGKELVQILVSDVKRRFVTSTAPDGSPWKPLKYRRPRGPGKPLLDTGLLLASITGSYEPNALRVGTNRAGAALHQFGGTVLPVKGKFLTIPNTPAAVRAGSPRRLTGTPSTPLFARRRGGEWVGHFILARKVVVPARPFLGVSQEGARALLAAIAADVAKNWQAAQPGQPR